ncbi:MAG TPA: TlpA disulfide reductase family protein [Granulicella sp.]
MRVRNIIPAVLLALLFATRYGAGQTNSSSTITGVWRGYATAAGSQQVPVALRITKNGPTLNAAFLNGPAEHPEESPASTVQLDGSHVTITFDYFARQFAGSLDGDTLQGTFGSVNPKNTRGTTPITLHRLEKSVDPPAVAGAPDIHGSWEIATKSSKGESAWEFRADEPVGARHLVKTVIQRIDGDTGSLWGSWNGTAFTVGHFTAAGPALYTVTPQADGTLLIKSLLGAGHAPTADWIARRPEEARKENLAAPTDPTQQTTVKDPSAPFAFRFPDLAGKTVSNTDPQFQGKVVIVSIGGSWCPNCHDEAPLLESLYKRFHSKGLEIVNVDFEQGDPDTDLPRLHAFIEHYGITYPVLVGGTTDQLAEAFPQAVNLNCWPTSFFLGRDGLVKEVHAGFAGPGNTDGHVALERDVTAFVEKLLAEKAPEHPVQTALN